MSRIFDSIQIVLRELMLNRGARMAKNGGITAPIYKIDSTAAVEFFGGNVALKELPAKLVEHYNQEKGVETYRLEGTAGISGCHMELYRNVKSQPNTSAWVSFFSNSGIQLKNIQNQMQHLVCCKHSAGVPGEGMICGRR
ncbi:MAG: hypothetical protein L0H41_14030, partial [Microlunatus sp.]|nr:hypothetical protein [Microlunatus sp.]